MAGPEVAETHISTLFFTEERVYKLLKPVATDFLDHRTPSARVAAAQAEVDLNRRLAPDVYLGTADVFEGDALVDRMIVMRRLPADRSMAAVIARSELHDDQLRAVAREIAAFHQSLEPDFDAEGPGTLPTHRANWDDCAAAIGEFTGSVLDPSIDDRIVELVDAFLDGHAKLFAGRVADGHVRDGHGDLLADDIFLLDDGPRILDCLAFDRRYRVSDVLADVAFLAMDLHRLAGPESAASLIHHYCAFSGEHHPSALAHHYVAYRAYVRCKIACLRVADGENAFGAVARMYHRLTLDQLERARTRVVLVGGGPGTGKTTLAHELGERLSWPVLSSDTIRKDLAGVSRAAHDAAEPDAGLYSPDRTEKTYAELLRRAELLLDSGHSVVLDASWTRAAHRQVARRIADRVAADLVELECRVPVAIAKERVVRRLADPLGVSDATPEIVDHLRDTRDPWPDATGIDTARPIAEVVHDALAAVHASDLALRRASDFWGTYAAFNRITAARWQRRQPA